MAPPSNHVRLEVKGASNFEGEFKGRGALTLALGDAAKARIGIDYRDADDLVLTLDSQAGITLSTDGTLTLVGGLSRDLVNREFGGEVSARLRISGRLQATIGQEFGREGDRTTLDLKITF